MAISPVHLPVPASVDARAASADAPTQATDGEAAVPPHHTRQGWLPHHGVGTPARVAHWITSMHRAPTQASMGMRAGGLIPPRGSMVGTGSSANAPGGSKGAGRLQRSSGRNDDNQDIDCGPLAESDAAIAGGESGADASSAVVRRGQAMGSGADGGGMLGSGTPPEAAESKDDGAAVNSSAHAAAASGASELGQTPAELARRLAAGQVCWTTSLRMAMECAQMHPGTDIFVQAFNVVGADGELIGNFSRRARLRAGEAGRVGVREEDAAPGAAAQNESLIDVLNASPLLGLTLRPVLDEHGDPVSLLAGLRSAELSELRRLFERLLPAGRRENLQAQINGLEQRWRGICAADQHAARLASHGDALERALQQARVQLSTTLSSSEAQAYRANANWQRAQAQVMRWVEREERPTLPWLLHLNKLLGEGLAPWNRAEQADRVGARFGELRHVDVVCGAPPRYFLRADQLPQAMAELFDWLDEQRLSGLHAAMVAAQAHQRLVSLHPFADANGRTARLAMDWLLQLGGLPPALVPAQEYALFADVSAAPPLAPGEAECKLVEGLQASLLLHAEWLHTDDDAH